MTIVVTKKMKVFLEKTIPEGMVSYVGGNCIHIVCDNLFVNHHHRYTLSSAAKIAAVPGYLYSPIMFYVKFNGKTVSLNTETFHMKEAKSLYHEESSDVFVIGPTPLQFFNWLNRYHFDEHYAKRYQCFDNYSFLLFKNPVKLSDEWMALISNQ